MVPTITGDAGRITPHDTQEGRVATPPANNPVDAAGLDAVIWRPGTIRLLDTDNQVIPRVWPTTAAVALTYLRPGGAAAVMARLCPGIRAIDLDLNAALASLAGDIIRDWCHCRGYAAITRPSGRPGHAHILIAGPAPTDAALDELCAAIRRDLGRLPSRAVDARPSGMLRTLTSPHRHGHPCAPITGDLARFAAAARAAIATHTPTTKKSASSVPRTTGSPAGRPPAGDGALVPRPRPHRALPAHIATWLTTGTEWTILGGTDHSRSTREAITTAEMVRAGWTMPQAWAAITAAHPAAMTRARASIRRWIGSVWNPAVEGNETPPEPPPLTDELLADLAAARARLDAAAATRLGPRARYAPLLVADTVLARMCRTRGTRTPVPERDLHEDIALDRTTIRNALRWLEEAGVIHLDRTTLDHSLAGRVTTSYEATLPIRDPSQTIPPEAWGVWKNPPPSSHTPNPAEGLPRSCHQLLRTLHAHGPAVVEDLAPTALLTKGAVATTSELNTTITALRAMAHVGLVEVDIQGVWHLTGTGLTPQAREEAARARARRTAHITAERTAYRAAATSDWALARSAALRAQRAKERAWWDGLTPAVQVERRLDYQMAYAELHTLEQVHLRAKLAARRAAHGIGEVARHHAWVHQWSDTEWETRVHQYTRAHAVRPDDERITLTAAWHHHRLTWGLPRYVRPLIPESHNSAALTYELAPGPSETFVHDQLPIAGADLAIT